MAQIIHEIADSSKNLKYTEQHLTDEEKNVARENIGITETYTKTEMLNLIYPVGSVYLSVNNVSPQTFIGGTWSSIGSGRVLQGADSSHAGGTTIEAGLPNITGSFGNVMRWEETYSGAFGKKSNRAGSWSNASGTYMTAFDFDASRSSSIYGKSATVQPPAFCVYMWKRTA